MDSPCSEHSKVETELKDLKDSRKDQWDCLNELKRTKVSTVMVTWVVGIFLVLSLAVVGFLWKGQVLLADKIENVQTVGDSRRQEIINKLDTLNTNFTKLETIIGVTLKLEKAKGNKKD